MSKRIECSEENAPKFLEWCRSRGGVAHWPSIDLSDFDKSWSTPALSLEGKPTEKPSWKTANEPSFVEKDPAKITVFVPKEVKRFRVAIRMGDSGLRLKVTDAGTRRIRREVEKAGEGAFYQFDYETQEAVIMVSDKECTLEEWAKAKGL